MKADQAEAEAQAVAEPHDSQGILKERHRHYLPQAPGVAEPHDSQGILKVEDLGVPLPDYEGRGTPRFAGNTERQRFNGVFDAGVKSRNPTIRREY